MEILIFLAIVAAVVIAELIYYRKHAMENLDLDINVSKPVASYGETIEVIEVVQNNKRTRLPFLLLKFEAPTAIDFLDKTNTSVSDLQYREDMLTMKPFSRHTRKIKALCRKRGYYTFPRVTILSTDLLFIEKFSREYKNDAQLTILPQLIPPEEIMTLLSITFSEIQRRRTLLTDPFSLSGIREYEPWDPMRSVNWTASAKTGELMVNVNASTSTRKVTIFLNLEHYTQRKSTILLEKSISLAYSYICELSLEGVPARVFTNGIDTVTGAPSVSEDCSLDPFVSGTDLARIDLTHDAISFPELVESNIGSTSADDFVVVISPRTDAITQKQLIDLKSKRPSLLWVIPSFKGNPLPDIDSGLMSSVFNWEVSGHD